MTTAIEWCGCCGNEIDPECCGCGDPMKSHGPGSGHSPVPLGCTCGYNDQTGKPVVLACLSPDHPLRTRPLREIGATIRAVHQRSWHSLAAWRIGRNTYNEVHAFWSTHHVIRAPQLKENGEV